MTKCPQCDGHGFELLMSRFGRIRKLECDICNGKGYLPMTNKEYYTETDEELAGFLSRTCRDLLASVVEDGGSVPNEYIEEDREFWLKWLKQPHSEVEE